MAAELKSLPSTTVQNRLAAFTQTCAQAMHGYSSTVGSDIMGASIVRDWNDLRFFLSVARLGSLSAASRSLKVDPATVGRRIRSLETALDLRCFERRADGYRLTESGRRLLEHAERVEGDLIGLSRAVAAEDRIVSGRVTVTASEAVTVPFLIPTLPGLRERHPGLRLDILSSNQVFNLARREADIALRMVRPDGGDLLTRRVATMGYGLYASDTYLKAAGVPSELEHLAAHNLIDWVEEYPKAATSAWFREFTEQNGATLRLNGSQERLAAVAAGIGIGCLPFIVARDTSLRRVLPSVAVPPMEVWMVTHPDSARVRRVRAVMDYLAQAAVAAGRRFSEPELSAHA